MCAERGRTRAPKSFHASPLWATLVERHRSRAPPHFASVRVDGRRHQAVVWRIRSSFSEVSKKNGIRTQQSHRCRPLPRLDSSVATAPCFTGEPRASSTCTRPSSRRVRVFAMNGGASVR
jgi:hypothetical protein